MPAEGPVLPAPTRARASHPASPVRLAGRAARALVLAALLAPGAGVAFPEDDAWVDSGERRVALIELYSSEGCSSCPPAERWLGGLRTHAGLWRSFVPIAFHVDYWDRLGWPDRFASPRYTNRQYRYVEALGLRSAYTPGFIVDGREWRGFYASDSLDLGARPRVGALRVRIGETRADVQFQPLERPERPLEVHVAMLGFGLVSDVSAGENQGRRLRQEFVVLGLSRAPLALADASDGSRQGVTLPLPPAEPWWPAERAWAAWVSHEGDPAPLQAAGAPLARPPSPAANPARTR